MNAKRKQVVRMWLVGLSVLAVVIGAGCGGAAKVIGRGVGRAAPEAVVVPRAVSRTPTITPLTSTAAKSAAATPGRAGKAASNESGGFLQHVPVDNLLTAGSGDDKRKK